MQRRTSTTRAAAVAIALLSVASTAHAQVAKFSKIKDAVPAKFFDALTSKPDPSNPNRLIIGLNTGFDPLTFVANDFRASALAFSNRAAMDTIAFKITAPSGYYIAKIIYTQQGAGATGRTSIEYGGATWVVNGVPASLGTFTSNPSLVGTADLSASRLTSVPVSITDSLFATTGTVAITAADVLVKLLPIVQ
jgi:hypothetical protein